MEMGVPVWNGRGTTQSLELIAAGKSISLPPPPRTLSRHDDPMIHGTSKKGQRPLFPSETQDGIAVGMPSPPNEQVEELFMHAHLLHRAGVGGESKPHEGFASKDDPR